MFQGTPGNKSAVQPGRTVHPLLMPRNVPSMAHHLLTSDISGMVQDDEDDDAWLQEYKRELGVA